MLVNLSTAELLEVYGITESEELKAKLKPLIDTGLDGLFGPEASPNNVDSVKAKFLELTEEVIKDKAVVSSYSMHYTGNGYIEHTFDILTESTRAPLW